MRKLLFLLMISPLMLFGQYEIKLTNSNYADVDVKFTTSNYADIDVRFVNSEYSADFTVGVTNKKNEATAAITESNYADLDIKITDSNYADIDIKITESNYADIDIMIKTTGTVDYLIYSNKYLDKNEIIVACLPIIKTYTDNKIKEDKIPLFFKDCGKILLPTYNTNISDEFEGWDFDDAIYELDNGLSVSSNTYEYTYSYRPSIQLYYCNGWYASVGGEKLKSVTVYK
jgi:hypothetical protein